jgi:hypothetical protein
MAKMKLQHQAVWGNSGICCGLALEYYRGAPLTILALTGAIVFLLFNSTLYFRSRKQHSQ